MSRRALSATLVGASLALTSVVAAAAQSAPSPAAPPTIAVGYQDVLPHLQQLQVVADRNGGHRLAGSPGHQASVDYVEAQLRAVGLTPQRQRCPYRQCSRASDNLIVEFPGTEPHHTFVYGAHLDSVKKGPGMNDNATGSSTLLAMARALHQTGQRPKATVRFAWWTDEENGLNGSKYYITQLSEAERKRMTAYFNFDMLGSRNGGYFINNIESPAGQLLKEYYDSKNIPTEEFVEGRGRSDDASFTRAGILASGIATGARKEATSEHATKWGLAKGTSFDVCYHLKCDAGPEAVNVTTMVHATAAIKYSIERLAF